MASLLRCAYPTAKHGGDARAFTVEWSDPVLTEWLYTVLALCAAVAILAAVCGPTWYVWCLSARPLVFFGRISYSLYLWHYGIFWTIQRKNPTWPGPVRLAVGVGAAVLVAWASYVWVEQPFLRRKTSRRLSVEPA